MRRTPHCSVWGVIRCIAVKAAATQPQQWEPMPPGENLTHTPSARPQLGLSDVHFRRTTKTSMHTRVARGHLTR